MTLLLTLPDSDSKHLSPPSSSSSSIFQAILHQNQSSINDDLQLTTTMPASIVSVPYNLSKMSLFNKLQTSGATVMMALSNAQQLSSSSSSASISSSNFIEISESDTGDDDDDGESQSLWSDQLGNTVLVFCYSLIVIVSLFGNTFVCRVMLSLIRNSSSRSSITTNSLIVNLAVSDLLLTTFNIPVNIAKFVTRDWPFGSVVCTATPFIQSLTAHCSAITMMVIAFERYRRLIGIEISPKLVCVLCLTWLKRLFLWLLQTFCRLICCWLLCCYCFRRWCQIGPTKSDKSACDDNKEEEEEEENQYFDNENDRFVGQNGRQNHRRSTFYSPPSSTTTSAIVPMTTAAASSVPASTVPISTTVMLTSVAVNLTNTKTIPATITQNLANHHHHNPKKQSHLNLNYQMSTRTAQTLDTNSPIRLVALIWLFSALLSIPYGLYNRVKVYSSFIGTLRMVRCVSDYPSQTVRFWLSILAPLSQYLLPIGLTALFYARIGYFLWRRNDAIGSVSEIHRMSIIRRKRNRVKMLVMVVLVFALCWLPLHINVSLIEFHIIQHNFAIYFVTHWIAMSSVCYNPFIYCWLNETFRRKTRSLFRMFAHWRDCIRRWFCCVSTQNNNDTDSGKRTNGDVSPSGVTTSNPITATTTTTTTTTATVVVTTCAEPTSPDGISRDDDLTPSPSLEPTEKEINGNISDNIPEILLNQPE